ncbi:MAG: hypothetical protein ACRDY1_07180, partial [Acidimicrobiales bacterium]
AGERDGRRAPGPQRPAGPARPWLGSQALWANFLQFVPPEGVALADVAGWAAITNLAGLQRWRYVVVGPDAIVRPTAGGRRAQEVWGPLAAVIERRWEERFGGSAVDDLRAALDGVVDRVDHDLPPYLPIVHPTQNGRTPPPRLGGYRPGAGGAPADLSTRLAGALLAFTLDFEAESTISLPVSANALRVLDATGIPSRSLPALTGVSKEALAMTTGFLARIGCVVVEADPTATRGRQVRLTAKGSRARSAYRRVLRQVEKQWSTRLGPDTVAELRRALERLVGPATAPSPLLDGLVPYPDGWRAARPRPALLPHHPMVLHRGAFPDGS